jgi:aspartate aminotransferase-like enzyme
MNSTKLLFAPGPVRVPNYVKYTFLQDPPYFTTSEFSKMLERIQERLRFAFRTINPVLIGTGSGSLGLEMAVANFFNKGDEIIVIDHGKYGQNWAKMASTYGLKPVILKESKAGFAVHPKHLKSSLNSCIKGVFITHVETTTAIRAPLEEYRGVIEEKCPNALIVVDAVSSLLTERLQSSLYDVVVSASQKALQLPPGLFFMAVSERAMDAAAKSKLPRFYFNVLNEWERSLRNITTFTPAAPLFQALDHVLETVVYDRFPEELIDETRTRAHFVREWCNTAGFDTFSHYPCNAVTAIKYESADTLIERLYNMNLVVGGGLREQKNKLFRIMHFGWEFDYEELHTALNLIKLCGNPYP